MITIGFWNKVLFWKKHDDFSDLSFDKELGLGGRSPGQDFGFNQGNDFNTGTDFGNRGTDFSRDNSGLPSRDPGLPSSSYQYPSYQSPQSFSQQPPSFQQSPMPPMNQQSPQDYMIAKDIEILSTKLDALRAGIENLNQRLANIERIAQGEQEERPRRVRW